MVGRMFMDSGEMQCYESEEHAANSSWWREEAACRRRFATPLAPEGWCPGAYDGWNCWNHTAPNTTAVASCPVFMQWRPYDRGPSGEFSSNMLVATKYCQADGTWWRSSMGREWANYTACFEDTSVFDFHLSLSMIWYIGYSFSIVLCLVALIVHCLFKSLDCGRTKVHQHLFLSYVLNCCSQIAWLRVQANVDVLMLNPAWCQFLHVVAIYLLLSNYAWMFCEGLYLYCVLKMAFVKERRLLIGVCVVGWGFPIIPTLTYVCLRLGCIQHSQQFQNCWTMLIPNLWWSYASFALVCQIFNFAFLIAILRLVYVKSTDPAVVDQSGGSVRKLLVLLRALFILVPLFGVQYLLSCFYRPTDPWSPLTAIYEICYALFTSLQGAAVATLFCFSNAEVKGVMSRKWVYWRSSRYGQSFLSNSLATTPVSPYVGGGSGVSPTSPFPTPAVVDKRRVLVTSNRKYHSLTLLPKIADDTLMMGDVEENEHRRTML